MTILGDRMQTMDEKQQDVTRFLPKIFERKVRKLEMNKSYRNTVEIAEYARALSGDQELELLMRHGQGVTEQTFVSKEALLDQVLIDVNLEKYETVLHFNTDRRRCFNRLSDFEGQGRKLSLY